MDPHCFDADPDPDPAQNLYADPDPAQTLHADPDPGGGGEVSQKCASPLAKSYVRPCRPLTSGLWIRICIRIDLHLSRWILVRIRIQKADPDPDPGGQNCTNYLDIIGYTF